MQSSYFLMMTSLPLFVVRLAAHVSHGLKSRIRPVVGRIQPKARVSIVRWNLKEAGFGEPTNPRANLWPDEQKPHMRSRMRVRLRHKSKPDNYTESCGINVAGRWRKRNVAVPGEICMERSERSKRRTRIRGGAEHAEVSRGHSSCASGDM